jgi:phosphate transport system substrate-binding protein
MKKILRTVTYSLFAALFFVAAGMPEALAVDGIKYDGSSQLYWAFVKDSADLFTKETGIKVSAEDRKTQDAVPSLVSGRCNVGGLARKMKLAEKAQNKDLVETLIANDHIAVFVSSGSKVDSLSVDQLRKVFGGQITDWKELGDAPGPIAVVIPQTKTTSNRNFAQCVMKDAPFASQCTITETAGAVLDQCKGKRAISFISFGAVSGKPDFKVLKVDGKSAGASDYPLVQEMYFATIGQPSGDVKKYVDFYLSGAGKEFIKKAGLIPAQ